MTPSSQPKRQSVGWWRLALASSVIGILGYAVGTNRARAKSTLSVAIAEAKAKSARNQSKKTAEIEGAKTSRWKSTFADLVKTAAAEDPRPLSLSPSFSHSASPGSSWVSVAAWGDEGFFFCDYSNVYYLDAKSWRLQMVPTPKIEGVWYPTGVACLRQENIILVANYMGHNVLEFRLADGRLNLEASYKCEGMKSPEGVALSHDGRLVSVADYDGDRLWVFNRRGSLAWQKRVGKAHGTAFGTDSVYVTSLMDKSITQFSLTGEMIRNIGRRGWGDSEFIWPTSVFADEQGVIISDAHTGRVTLLKHDLSFIDSFGGNGPGTRLFNMPYCTIRHRNNFWICDTLKLRILQTSPSREIVRLFSAIPPAPSSGEEPHLATARWNYTDLSTKLEGKAPQFPDGLIFPDYGRLMRMNKETGDWRPLDLQLATTSLWSEGMFTYFTWMRPVIRGGLNLMAIGSCSQSGIFIVHADGRCSLENKWRRSPLQPGKGGVYEISGALFDLEGVADSALKKFERHDALLKKPGTRRLEAARAVFWPEVTAAHFGTQLASEFKSKAGKKFWASFSEAAHPSEEEAAAAEYDAEIRKPRSDINLTEYWLRRILVH